MPPNLSKKILFVDDDANFLSMVQRAARIYSDDSCQVLTAIDATAALAAVQQQKIDLVAIDLHMPVVNGMQLLALLQRKYPSIVKVILTGDNTSQHQTAALNTGAELFLEKPTSREAWKSTFAALHQLTSLQQEEGFHGVMRQVSLPDVLQLSCLAKQSIILCIRAAEVEGSIYVQDGNIIHAQCGAEQGEPAFNHLMNLAGGQFELKTFVPPEQQTINQSWEFLVMEAARKQDEITPPPTGNTELLFKQIATSEAADPLPAAEAAAALPPQNLQPRIDEVLVCSANGEVLHQWQCPSTAGRVSFLQMLARKTAELGQLLPLGAPDRFEVNGGTARMIAQFHPEHTLLVRTARVPAPANPANPR